MSEPSIPMSFKKMRFFSGNSPRATCVISKISMAFKAPLIEYAWLYLESKLTISVPLSPYSVLEWYLASCSTLIFD